MFAARAGDAESAKLLVPQAPTSTPPMHGGSARWRSPATPDSGTCRRALLAAGADPNAAGAGFAPLHAAVLHRDQRLVGAL